MNQPTYNPNDRSQLDVARYRNRAATDILEPGSSFKPFILAAALESGQYSPDSLVDTSPGTLSVNGRVLTEDNSNLGIIDVTTVLARSSNVGAAQIALSLDAGHLWQVLSGFGIGRLTDSGFPGESGRRAQRPAALAGHRPGDAFVRLRRVGHRAAVGPSIRGNCRGRA